MNEAAAERPAVRLPFRWLVAIALGFAVVAFVGGRYIFKRHGGYRPIALAHVPQTMRYRARVEVHDAARAPLLAPLLTALDPSGRRWAGLQGRVGSSLRLVTREVAFGAGTNPSDFVLVLGMQLPVGARVRPAKALCEVLAWDGMKVEQRDSGCLLPDGSLLADALDGMLVLASRPELVKDLLGVPELGDRMGFSGPSVRGVAPEVEELRREVNALSQVLAPRYR
jgi:hypothetical protein